MKPKNIWKWRHRWGTGIEAKPSNERIEQELTMTVTVTELRIGAINAILAVALLCCGCAGGLSGLPVVYPDPPAIDLGPEPENNYAARKIYVDGTLTVPVCSSYSVSERRCNDGEVTAYRHLERALRDIRPGDRLFIRSGRYAEQIRPARSGRPGKPILISSHDGDKVVVADLDQPAIYLKRRHYIVIQGLHFENVLGWGRLEDAAYNRIANNHFRKALARGTTGGLKLVRSHYNQIRSNAFEHGNDSLVVQASDRNVIEDNRFRWARHSLMSVRCGNFNVIRGNRFHNERQKAMEIYDCEGISDAPYRLDATKRNLIEKNVFEYTRGPSAPHKYNAIQMAGQAGLVRQNIFVDNRGGGIGVQVYADEALFNYGHRIYNNTFVANQCYAISSSSAFGRRYEDIELLNNIFHKNEGCHGEGEQLLIGDPWALRMTNNAVLAPKEEPGFQSEAKGDLRLKENSPLIDRGIYLTRTIGKGVGTKIQVKDVTYFYDGFGINGESGDRIRIEGDANPLRILHIDYDQRVLTVDRNISWDAGQGVGLIFIGSAPDLGAVELGSD